jgi:hypothetical protein
LVAHHDPFQAKGRRADMNHEVFTQSKEVLNAKSARPLKKRFCLRGGVSFLACQKGRKKIICRQVGKRVQSIQDRTGVLLLNVVMISQSWQIADFSSLL